MRKRPSRAMECGRRGKPPKLEDIFSALAVIGELAERQETESEDEVARSWGETFLEQVDEQALD